MTRLLGKIAAFLAYSIVIACGVFLFTGIVGGAVVLYVLYHMDSSSAFDTPGGCLGAEPYSQQWIEERGELVFPESAQNITARSFASGRACTVYISFEMASDDLQPFLESTSVSSIEPTSGSGLSEFFQLVLFVDWRLPQSQTYLYGEGGDGINDVQYIVVDPSSAEPYMVYVVTFLD
jgi:hypothetical protein